MTMAQKPEPLGVSALETFRLLFQRAIANRQFIVAVDGPGDEMTSSMGSDEWRVEVAIPEEQGDVPELALFIDRSDVRFLGTLPPSN